MKNLVKQLSHVTKFSKIFDGNIYTEIDKIIISKLQGTKISMKTDYIDLALHTYQIQGAGTVDVKLEDPWNTIISSEDSSLLENITKLLGEENITELLAESKS